MIQSKSMGMVVIFVILFVRVAQPQESENHRPSPPELLEALVSKPSVATLRQLLAPSGFDAAEPLSLVQRQNPVGFKDNPAVVRISTDVGDRVVTLVSVRPRGAEWIQKDRSSYPSEAAFIFDDAGQLVKMLGGGESNSGSQERVMLANLGATGDYFLRVSAFEPHPPYECYSRWYRIGAEGRPSLTTHQYANSTSWSGANSNSNPIAEYGFVAYNFNGQEIDQHLPGTTAECACVPRQILWDGLRNKFFAEPMQRFNGKSLYQVIVEQSADYIPVQANSQTLVIAGGRRGFHNWHKWIVTVQDDQRVIARLVLRDNDGKLTRLIHEAPLSPGQHKLQLHIENAADAIETRIQVMVDAKDTEDKTRYTIPRMQIDARPSVAGQRVYVADEPPVRLFEKRLSDEKDSLVWLIEGRTDS